MKHYLPSTFMILGSLFLVLTLAHSAKAQNLLANPSFENISSCPTAQSQIANATGWDKPPSSGTTPDLFHSCHPGGAATCGNVDLPGGWAGAIVAYDGDAAAGVLTRYDFCGNCREYIQTQFSTPMVAGVTYDVEYFVICPPTCKYETNGLDAYIGANIPQPGNQPITAFSPQITSPVVTKAMGWTQVTGSYTATGGENFITLGNYKNDAGTTFNTVTGSGSCVLTSRGATYLFDMVTVTEQVLLDLNLLYFEATKLDEDKALLEWNLSNTMDYEFLNIQRSVDGINFSNIAEELNPNTIEYIDFVPQPGVNYYRLRFKKWDGTVETSSIKTLTFDYTSGFSYNIFPNPFEDRLQLEIFNEMEAQDVSIRMFDVTGRIVYQMTFWMENGRQIFSLNPSTQLPPAVYIAQFEVNGITHQQKIVKK